MQSPALFVGISAADILTSIDDSRCMHVWVFPFAPKHLAEAEVVCVLGDRPRYGTRYEQYAECAGLAALCLAGWSLRWDNMGMADSLKMDED